MSQPGDLSIPPATNKCMRVPYRPHQHGDVRSTTLSPRLIGIVSVVRRVHLLRKGRWMMIN